MAADRREDSQFVVFPFHVHFEECGVGKHMKIAKFKFSWVVFFFFCSFVNYDVANILSWWAAQDQFDFVLVLQQRWSWPLPAYLQD